MKNNLSQIAELGQAIWVDHISRDSLRSGELAALVRAGVTGLTSNPTIFQKAIAQGAAYDDQIRELADRAPAEIFEALAVRDIRDAADTLRTVYDETQGRDGFVSFEVSPRLADDTDATVAEARRLWTEIDRPNLMIKVPATAAGVPAVRTLIASGINVNVTLIFAIEMYERIIDAYVGGLHDRRQAGRSLQVASVASFFVSRVDNVVDARLEQLLASGVDAARTLRGQAAIANAKIAYDRFVHAFMGAPFRDLRSSGARAQRPLWASTSTKNPDYSPTKYVDALIGPNTVNTVPPVTLAAIETHATTARSVDIDVEHAYAVVEKLGGLGIPMSEVTAGLLVDGVRAFADSYDQLLADVEVKRSRFARA